MEKSSETKKQLLEEISALKKINQALNQLMLQHEMTEKKLEESEDKYRMIFNAAPLGIFRSTPEGQFIEVNPALAKMLGYESPAAVMQNIHNIAEQIYVRSAERQPIVDKQLLMVGVTQHDNHYRRADGSEFFAHLHLKTIRDEAGQPLFLEGIIEDITELKQLESLREAVLEKLRASEERYRIVADFTYDWEYWISTEGNLLYVSPSCLRITGWQADELQADQGLLIAMVHPDDRRMMIDHLQHLDAKVTCEMEFRIITRDGEERWISHKCQPVFGEQGRHLGQRGSNRDITGRKQAEAEVIKSLEQLAAAHQLAHIGLWNWEAKTDTVTWTEELYRIFSRDLLLPAPTYAEHASIYTPESWGRLKNAVEQSLKTGEPYQLELQLIRSDGITRWASAFGCANFDQHGKITGLHGTLQDITIRKEAEEKYRILFENASEAICVVQEGRVVFLNPAISEMTGYSADEILSRGFADFIHPADRDMVMDRYTRRIKGEDVLSRYSYRLIHKNGSILRVELNSALFNWQGKPATLNFLSDITLRRQIDDVQAFLAQSSSGSPDKPFFPKLAKYLGRALEMDFVCIDRLEGDGLNATTVAVWCDGHFEDNITYALKDTPCGDVVGKTICSFPASVGQFFPRDQVLQDLRAESYVGATLWSHDGRPIGLIALIARRPLANRQLTEKTLQMVASRAAGELERLAAEEAIRKSEAEYRTLFNEMLEGFALHEIICDEKGQPVDYRFLAVNPAFERLTGLTAKDIVGRTVLEVLPGTEQHWIETYGRVALTGEATVFENYAQQLKKHFEVTAFCPAPRQFACIFADITERKLAEEALRSNHDQLETLWHIASLVDADSKTITDHILTSIVRITKSQFGFYGFINDDESVMTIHTWSGQAMSECRMVDKPQSYPIAAAGIWGEAVRRREQFILNDYSAPHSAKKGLPSGHVTLTNLMVVPHFYHGRITAVAAVANREGDYKTEDANQITAFLNSIQSIIEHRRSEEEREKLQNQLSQAMKMDSIGRLAGGVAHDFNNMLGVIIGRAEMALDEIDPSHSIHTDITEILKAAERSANLTRQLLAFARKQTIAPIALDLNETVEGILKMLRHLIGENIDLQWQPGADLWPIMVDPSQVDQILANLCVNALDAIQGIGKITIATENSKIDDDFQAAHIGAIPGEYVQIVVSDSGCGMSPETLEHIYEPFFTTKRVGEGTGLGLPMIYGAIKQNHGFIDVLSKLNEGTTFTIYLPRHVGKMEQMLTGGMSKPVLRGKETILLVEDEVSILQMTAQMLQKHGYTVLAASSPGEAIQLAREYPGEIHLLVTDVIMPEMNGWELGKNILSIYPLIKRLFMSGYTADVIAHQGVLDVGVNFIHKPFSQNAINAKTREILDEL